MDWAYIPKEYVDGRVGRAPSSLDALAQAASHLTPAFAKARKNSNSLFWAFRAIS